MKWHLEHKLKNGEIKASCNNTHHYSFFEATAMAREEFKKQYKEKPKSVCLKCVVILNN